MKKVSIITRAYNRLEYTTQCINDVRNNTIYPNYEHIIINNNSSDGTREWLEWIKGMENNWFEKVIPAHLSNNYHDWNGMREGLKFISEDSEYIVQLDNDISVPKNWLTHMINTIESVDNKVIQLKRTGVQTIITPKNIRQVGEVEGGDITTSVACYMVRTKDFKEVINEIGICDSISGKLNSSCFKILNVKCHQIEGWDGKDYIQHEKYQPSSERVYSRTKI
jgi:glycosyltransferase involved in cell wall biosynthesis